jgi:hypothetical protein
MRQLTRWAVGATIVMNLAACGARSVASAPAMALQSRPSASAPGTPSMAAGTQQAGRGILNHPFVTWVKQQHPGAAVAIINDYLGIESSPGADTVVENERSELRTQVIQTVQAEFTRSLDRRLPDDLRATSVEDRIRIAGRVKYQIHDIQLTFDMTVRLDEEGKIWVALDERSVEANAMNPLVGLFGGNLDARAIKAVKEAFDKEGPSQVGKVAGLHYVPGAIFYIDCGEAFVHTKTLPSESSEP